MNIVTIGGGGGHAQVLKGLKYLPGLNITAICPSTDSGGSTGYLRRDYGISGYLGDLTKCIAALCPNEELARTLLYRFDSGCLNGHSVKNVLFLGLEKVVGLERALEMMYQVCDLGSHRVMPVSKEQTELRAILRLGNEIRGETQIDNIAQNPLWHPDYHAIEDIYLMPKISASSKSLEAVRKADWLVVCPGDLYSSILPVVLPRGMKEALVKGRARVVIIVNIMTKKGETDKYGVMDFVARIEQYLGSSASKILCNNYKLGGNLLLKYALEQKIQLVVSEDTSDPRMCLASLSTITEEGAVYHDPAKVAIELAKIFAGKN